MGKVCFYRFRRICPAKKCWKDYEMYGNHTDLKCPEGMYYKEDEIPGFTPNGIEYILKTEQKSKQLEKV